MGEYVNSKQVRFDKSYASCGIVEAHHLPSQPVQRTAFAIATHLYHKANPRPACFILFSDVAPADGTKSNGQMLAVFLASNTKFGYLHATTREINPRTGNTIVAWLFTPNHEHFRKWYQDELANRITEE